MVDALVGIAAAIYIFKFLINLFKPDPAVWRCRRSTVAVATGQNRSASVAMMPKSGGLGRAVRSFTSKHLVDEVMPDGL